MHFVIKFRCDGDAFGDLPEGEVARILHKYAERVREEGVPVPGDDPVTVLDLNGNAVGAFYVTKG